MVMFVIMLLYLCSNIGIEHALAMDQEKDIETSEIISTINNDETALFATFILRISDVNRVANQHGASFLHYAAFNNRPDMIRLLAERDAYIDDGDNFGNTPLHYAAEAGAHGAVHALLSVGAQVNIRSQTGFTPLRIALRNGHRNIAALLLRHGAYASSTTVRTILTNGFLQAAALSHLEVLSMGEATHADLSEALEYAVGQRNEDAVSILVKRGAHCYSSILLIDRIFTRWLMDHVRAEYTYLQQYLNGEHTRWLTQAVEHSRNSNRAKYLTTASIVFE